MITDACTWVEQLTKLVKCATPSGLWSQLSVVSYTYELYTLS